MTLLKVEVEYISFNCLCGVLASAFPWSSKPRNLGPCAGSSVLWVVPAIWGQRHVLEKPWSSLLILLALTRLLLLLLLLYIA
jgi:hypothetical protein